MPVFFSKGSEVFVPQAQIKREVLAKSPIVVREGVIGPGAQVVGAGPEAGRSSLREAEEEIGKIEPGAICRDALRAKSARRVSAEGERAARAGRCERVDLDEANLPSNVQIMIASRDDCEIGKAKRLVAGEGRNGVIEAGEIGEIDQRNTPVHGILRNTLDSEIACDVLSKGERIKE